MTSPITAEQLLVRAELDDLLRRLARAVDRADRDAIAACYTADSLDDHGSFVGTGAEFADYITTGSPISGNASFIHHMLGQSLYTFEGVEHSEQVYGETYFVMHLQTEPGTLFVGIGRYLDHFVHVDGRWLIRHRQLVTEWSGLADAKDLGPGPEHAPARRDRDDPLYHFVPGL